MRSARILRDYRVMPPALGRREVLIGAGAAGMALAAEAIVPAHAQSAAGKPDHALRISPVLHELAPGKGDREVEAPVMIDKRALKKWVIR